MIANDVLPAAAPLGAHVRLAKAPREYFDVVTRAHAGWRRPTARPPAPSIRRSLQYAAGDPALRLFPDLELPVHPDDTLLGAVVVLASVLDRDRERLLYDIGLTRIRAESTHAGDMLTLVLSRSDRADVYRAVLRTLRYRNLALPLTPGSRELTLSLLAGDGAALPAARRAVSVGSIDEDVR